MGLKIAVMGAGGIGGYFGAKLAQAGHDVGFVARGRHLAAIRANGLKVLSETGDVHLPAPIATDDPADLTEKLGPVDVILFMVKTYDTETAARQCLPLLSEDTAVITFQNGIQSVETLSEILGASHVLGGVANISAIIEEPGVIRHYNQLQILRFGELDDRSSARSIAFLDACQGSGIEAVILQNTLAGLWTKFIFLASTSAANCLARGDMGLIRSEGPLRRLTTDLVTEATAVAQARGIKLPSDQVEQTMSLIDGLPATMKTSMLAALERGEKLEADWLCGHVAGMGDELGIPTPTHRAAYAALYPWRNLG
ncbi:MAG: 2-dehydropantoate 2-reductase [Alphaproteobacteria bacterium]|nr:2-dehydropantoate 2-reductase [Alphaproteobacteria bacterium]